METKQIVCDKDKIDIVTAESAITATNEPVAILCAGAKRIAIEFTESGTVNNRSGVLTITASVDGGTTFRAYNMLISNAANDAGAGTPGSGIGFTRVASVTRATAGTDLVWMDPATLGPITHIKSTVTITDGGSPTGNFTVKASIKY